MGSEMCIRDRASSSRLPSVRSSGTTVPSARTPIEAARGIRMPSHAVGRNSRQRSDGLELPRRAIRERARRTLAYINSATPAATRYRPKRMAISRGCARDAAAVRATAAERGECKAQV